ncbi:DUF4352 domain-containing protein [Thermobifida halotolerans]|uniref:DUF4352 domain-containing protein n=1 Tax=Thermobifida halotolerans TaxID=483545 RepID=A0A399FWE1_9ACTN|nr:DUF4352 domain-containing protein [Thermobifida halotolerans]UOE18955.1 DUF4352 domain-containing protein [Thermobifida halotolerans]
MERTTFAAAVVGGTALAVGSLLSAGLHSLPGQDVTAVRSTSAITRSPSTTPDSAAPRFEEMPEPADFEGVTASTGDWRLRITEVRVDSDGVVTGDTGSGVHAPEGTAYHVFTLQVTNNGPEPRAFAPAGSTAASVDGRTFPHDPEAERAAADGGDPTPAHLAPGASTEVDVVFPVPSGAHLYEIAVTVEYGAVFANLEARD